jgi:hypothetical protein
MEKEQFLLSADFSVVAFRSLFLELLPLLQLFIIRKTNTVYTLQSFGVSFALPVSRTILNKHRKNYRFDQQQFYVIITLVTLRAFILPVCRT